MRTMNAALGLRIGVTVLLALVAPGALAAEAGWTRFERGTGHITALSGAVGVPLVLAGGGSGARGALLMTSAFGFGRVSVLDESESGTRPLLGGGVAVSTGAATLNLGFKKVFIESGRTLLGAGVAWRLGSGAS